MAEQAGDAHLPAAGAPRSAARHCLPCRLSASLRTSCLRTFQAGIASRMPHRQKLWRLLQLGHWRETSDRRLSPGSGTAVSNQVREVCGDDAGRPRARHLEPDDRALEVPPRQWPWLRVFALLLPVGAAGALDPSISKRILCRDHACFAHLLSVGGGSGQLCVQRPCS